MSPVVSSLGQDSDELTSSSRDECDSLRLLAKTVSRIYILRPSYGVQMNRPIRLVRITS
jgi:hypothetical protein